MRAAGRRFLSPVYSLLVVALLVTGCRHPSPPSNAGQAPPGSEDAGSTDSGSSRWSARQVSGGGRADSRTAPPEEGGEGDSAAGRRAYEEALVDYLEMRARSLLEPAFVPPPGVDPSPQERRLPGVGVEVRPLRPEEVAWNQWDAETSRLFNNAAGYLWAVQIESSSTLRWLPDQSRLLVNEQANEFSPSPTPSVVLRELALLSQWQRTGEAPYDFQSRLAAATPFKERYLPLTVPPGDHAFVVLFPAPAARLDPVAMQLELAFYREGRGVERFSYLFE